MRLIAPPSPLPVRLTSTTPAKPIAQPQILRAVSRSCLKTSAATRMARKVLDALTMDPLNARGVRHAHVEEGVLHDRLGERELNDHMTVAARDARDAALGEGGSGKGEHTRRA